MTDRWLRSPRALLVALVALAGLAGGAGALRAATPAGLYDGTAPERVRFDRVAPDGATLAAPRLVAPAATLAARPDPVWTRHGLWASPPAAAPATPPDDVPVSAAVWDPSSEGWFATTAGALVRLGEDGSRRVIVDDVQGRDFDVRARARVAVSREPDDRIVLHRFSDGGAATHTALLEGPAFFQPRFSPDGDAVLVAESRAGGGHVWLVRLADGVARDLGQGYGAAWHPDGRRVLFARVENDGLRVTAADLWQWDLSTGAAERLTDTLDRAETEPAVSPDGRFVAWTDGRTGALWTAALPTAPEGGRR